MANPPDNSGKPPAPPGIAPAVPRQPGPPSIAPAIRPASTAPAVAPARPPTSGPSGIAPAIAPARPAGASSPSLPTIAPAVPRGPPTIAPAAPRIAPTLAPAAPRVAPPVIATAAPPAAPRAPAATLATSDTDALTPQLAAQLKQQAEQIEGLDYFAVLKVPQTASLADIKRAFYRESRVYHPDRFFHIADVEAKKSINTLYKRITEAYYVLRDEQKRRKYVVDITGPERATKLRYTEASETEQKAEAKKAADEVFGTNPKARQFYKTALSDIDKQSWQAAERNLKSAITFEPSNAKFKEKLAEIQGKLDELRRSSGDSFKIK